MIGRSSALRPYGARAALVLLAVAVVYERHTEVEPTSQRASSAPVATTTTVPATFDSRPGTSPTAPKVTLSTIPASVPHDCSVDVSAAIQAWIDSTPDEAVLSLIRGGCYRVDETLFVKNRNHVVIDGQGRHASGHDER